MISAIDDSIVLGPYGDVYGGVYMTGLAKAVNDKFFAWNGMQAWNTGVRTAVTQAGMRFIVRHAEGAARGDAQSARFLRELGLAPADVKTLLVPVGHEMRPQLKLTEAEGSPRTRPRKSSARSTPSSMRPRCARAPRTGQSGARTRASCWSSTSASSPTASRRWSRSTS